MRVTPDVSSKAVLIVGSQKGPTVWNGSTVPAGDAVAPGETLGQAAVLNKYTRVNLPFVPERHDTMRLRIKGTGQIAVRSIAFSMAESRGNRVAGGEPKR